MHLRAALKAAESNQTFFLDLTSFKLFDCCSFVSVFLCHFENNIVSIDKQHCRTSLFIITTIASVNHSTLIFSL